MFQTLSRYRCSLHVDKAVLGEEGTRTAGHAEETLSARTQDLALIQQHVVSIAESGCERVKLAFPSEPGETSALPDKHVMTVGLDGISTSAA